MDAVTPVRRAYARLGRLTPIPGKLCGKKCCKGSGGDGMILFPGEDAPSFTVSEREINGFPVRFAVCSGHCRRERRPLSCRIYPFAPHLDENGTLRVCVSRCALRL